MFDDTQLEQQQEQNVPEVVQEQAEESTEQPKVEENKNQELNFRKLKEQKERAERDLEKMVRYVQDLQAGQQQTKQDAIAEEDDLPIGADDVAEGKHVKKVYKEVVKLRNELKQQKQQSQEAIADAKMKALYPDADKVLSVSNLNVLSERYPEIANTIHNSSSDQYGKMVTAYTMIKNLGLYEEDPTFTTERIAAQKNLVKPRPLTSIAPQQGDTPLSKANAFANGLNDTLKKQLYKEMIESMRG